MRYALLLAGFFLLNTAVAQDSIAVHKDTVAATLPSVTINAYGIERGLHAAPAAINYIGAQQLSRFADNSVLQALNATPGIRMEERSPGSYRLNIRGSSLRSPFGVRNVKIYYNDIPLSDPTGFTYFNQLGYYNIRSMQVIKGPGSSLYGAGTGGVLLVNSMSPDTNKGASVLYEVGSYGLSSLAAELNLSNEHGGSIIRYQRYHSDGYRQQSWADRNTFSWDGSLGYSSHGSLKAHFLYNDLNYGTPGALTLAEYEKDPLSARPTIGTVIGSVDKKTAIYQQNVLAGLSSVYDIATAFQNTTTVYLSYTQFNNPTIRNYTRSIEPHFGGRSVFKYNVIIGENKLQALAGLEAQKGYVLARTYQNNNGNPDSLQADDETRSTQLSCFAQLNWQLKRWTLEAGLSINKADVNITRLATSPAGQDRDYPMQASPRVALSFHAAADAYVYANVAKGFSPPAATELLPTGGILNNTLAPETGWNYELGTKGSLADQHIDYDISVYYFTLQNTIVLRKDALGGDTYINAGATQQPGLEASLSYNFRLGSFFSLSDVWLSYTGCDFRYWNFIKEGTDYSGKLMPGVAPNTISSGLDLNTKLGLALNISYFFSDRIALNDANAVYASPYHILDVKLGYAKSFRRFGGKIFAGVNNLLDQKYSLGNDINAAGGRYYNAAPGINYYAGLMLSFK